MKCIALTPLFVCVLFSQISHAQPDVLWTNTFDLSKWDEVRSVIAVDNGYMIAGGSGRIDTILGQDLYAARLDLNGQPVWQNLYLDDVYFWSHSGMVLPYGSDQFVVFMTVCETKESEEDIGYAVLDGDGSLIEHGLYNVSAYQFIEDVAPTSDGGYIIAALDGYPPNWSIRLMKIGPSLDLQWHQEHGGTSKDWPYCVLQTQDGGFLVAGSSESFGGHDNECYVVKTDGQGNLEQQSVFGTGYSERINDIIETGQDEYTGLWTKYDGIWGEVTVFSFSFENGHVEHNHFDGLKANRMMEQEDGTILFTGTTYHHLFLKCTTMEGFPLWETQITPSCLNEVGNALCESHAGGYIVAGSKNTAASSLDIFMLCFDSYTGIETEARDPDAFWTGQVTPNPFTASVSLEFNAPVGGTGELLVFDSAGRLVDSVDMVSYYRGLNSVGWTAEEDLPAGCYSLVLYAGGETLTERCVLLR